MPPLISFGMYIRIMHSSQHFTLKLDDKKFFFRPLLPSDKLFIQKGFRELSSKSKYLRFFAHQKELTKEQLKFYADVDGKDHVAWGVMDVTGYGMIPAGTARFVRLKDDSSKAEVAITIVDKYHGLGLARIMIAILNLEAYKLGIRTFSYHVLPDNQGILESLNPLAESTKTLDKDILLIDAEVFEASLKIPVNSKTKKIIEAMKVVEGKLG